MTESLRLRRLLLLGCISLIGLGSPPAIAAPSGSDDFPQPEGLSSAVAFWMRVYLEVTTQQGLLHDSSKLGVVYETIRFDGRTSRRAQERWVDERKRHWRGALRRLAKGGFDRGPLVIETLAPGDLAETLQQAKQARRFVEELTRTVKQSS